MYKLKSDFDLVVHSLDRSLDYIEILPIGDTQIGSSGFDEALFDHCIKYILENANCYTVLVGDLLNFGLKTSKTNSYEEVMRPRDQILFLKEKLEPLAIAGKILGIIPGNHENRGVYQSDMCPIFQVAESLGISDLYRENMEFIKISLGEKNKSRQFSYIIGLVHGTSQSKADKFGRSIEGLDVLLSGHTHTASSSFPARVVIDPHNNKARVVGFKNIVVPSFDRFGGYSARGMYVPQDSELFPIVRLSGKDKVVDIVWKTIKRYL